MRKLIRRLGMALGAIVLVLASFGVFVAMAPLPSYETRPPALQVDVTPERVARGKRHVELLCAGCHFDSGTGGLTGKRMVDVPTQFGWAYSKNITADPAKGIGAWSPLPTRGSRSSHRLPPTRSPLAGTS